MKAPMKNIVGVVFAVFFAPVVAFLLIDLFFPYPATKVHPLTNLPDHEAYAREFAATLRLPSAVGEPAPREKSTVVEGLVAIL